jgi:UDP-glucose 4-epimerase
MRRALVTGGAGFIGSHVADALLADGWDVLVVDDLSAGDLGNVPAGVELSEVDIVREEPLLRVFQSFRPRVVCHLAAQASVTASVKDPLRDLEVNVRGTCNVCEAARETGARVVFASTGGALYGEGAPIPTAESFPTEPLAPYGASKLAGEAYVGTWGRLHRLPNVILRLGNVYGPRQNPHGEAGVVAIFSERLRSGLEPTVFGDGLQTRDYVHVLDVAGAFLLAAASSHEGVFNVGRGIEVTVLELLGELQRAAGSSIEPKFEPLRTGELFRSALDAGRIRSELGWRPQVELRQGLAETFRSYAREA